MNIDKKLTNLYNYHYLIANLGDVKSQSQVLCELCEVAELEFISKGLRGLSANQVEEYAKLQSKKHDIPLDAAYLSRRWHKLYKKKIYKDISAAVQDIFKRDNHTCQYCSAKTSLHIHHVIPKDEKQYGGPDSYFNLVLACDKCNVKISNNIIIPRNWWTLHPESHYAFKA